MLTAAPTTARRLALDVQGPSQVRRAEAAARTDPGPRRWARRVVLLAGLCGCATSCASQRGSSSKRASSTMVKNEIVARVAGVTAELSRVEYGPESVQLRVELNNGEDAPLLLDRHGVLLAYDGLEYPAAASPSTSTRPDPLEVAPAQTIAFDVTFELGRPLGGDARLMLRTLRRGERWLDPVALTVPATPPALGPAGADDPQGSRGP